VVIRIEIGADGRVTVATVASTTLGDEAVGRSCVVQGARFPAHGVILTDV
jgi:hypothetical protein